MSVVLKSPVLTRRALLGGLAASTATAILAACGDATPTTAPPTTAPATTAPTVGAATVAPTTSAATVAPAAPTAAGMPTTAATTAPTAAATVAPTAGPTSAATTAMTTGTAATSAPAVTSAPPSAAAMMGSMNRVVFNAPPLTKRTAAPKGTLIYAPGTDFPSKVDALKSGLTNPGVQEMLTRVNYQTGKLEGWLAERVENIDPLTWRITVRDAKFQDGSPITTDDMIAAFRKNWDAYPDLKGLISPDSKLNKIDNRTLEVVTPQLNVLFPYILALSSTSIHKPSTPGGMDGSIMTGPYHVTKLDVGNQMQLEAFVDHWGGPPPIARIDMRLLTDPNARVLALQSGDVDLLWYYPAESLKLFGPDIQTSLTPSGRVGLLSFNVNRPPFTDRDVREAFSLGIDRSILNAVAFDGKGTPAAPMFPPISGYDTIPVQSTDVNRARQLLDNAGWKPGADGVRAKGNDRLAVTIISGPSRPDQTPSAVSIQSQLKPLGIEIKVMELQDSSALVKAGTFDALMKANNTLPTGNPLYEYNRLFQKGGGDNVGNYSSPKIDDLIAQMRVESDPKKAAALSLQVQDVVKQDVPLIFMTFYPITVAYKKAKVKGFVPNPDDSFVITPEISVS